MPADASPALTRRQGVGSASARSLLLTVLGELVLPSTAHKPPAAWTSAFIETLALVDVEEKSARQALARTAAAGWIDSVRHGRRAAWRLTAAGRRLLGEGAARIYGFQGVAPDWDGRWLLVLVSVPETDRGRRHLLRSRLGWVGLGSPSPGLWVSPYPDRQDEVRQILAEAGVEETASSFVARDGEIGDPIRMAQQAWDLTDLERRYDEFRATFDGLTPKSPEAALRAQIQLVHEWRRFPLLDPALPSTLLPADWSGVQAGVLFRRQHQLWSNAAQSHWQALVSAG
ncbi:MAG: PaaX family transcriptional regulator [Geodermatophilaceae bacterium]